ncbi:unnamed protein product [Rangifer tarandus platyrhynchus]|uniref:Uncharacterized protein n=2 Tax=Rangifer tarandus platyrhynchus TaxID=3082113 RepID=A0AC59YJW4_RANTA|nr:unnamed protein product [Rangifer tarandus platyrhynchus]
MGHHSIWGPSDQHQRHSPTRPLPGVLPSAAAAAAAAQAWPRCGPLGRWNWTSRGVLTPPVGAGAVGGTLWITVELAQPEGGVGRVCGLGTQLWDHRLSAGSCHACPRTALLRLGLWPPQLLTGARASPLLPPLVQGYVKPGSACE